VLYAFFWVIPWGLHFICQHSKTLCLFHLHRWTGHTYLPMKMEQTECSGMSTYKIQTPRNYPDESIQHSEIGECLKSGIKHSLFPPTVQTNIPWTALHISGSNIFTPSPQSSAPTTTTYTQFSAAVTPFCTFVSCVLSTASTQCNANLNKLFECLFKTQQTVSLHLWYFM